jgi:micrococcal nuclease
MDRSQMVFLNLGGDYPNQKLSVVIKGKDRDKFPISPEIAFKDKTICVTGVVSDYNGKPEIVVTDPAQIKVQ